MAQVSKISSFKSFTEIKNQETTMKLREKNNTKRQETVGKIGAILDEMGLTSLSELDEAKKKALINKMFGSVSEDEAEDIEDELNKLGEPKKLKEGNAFGDAVKKAKEAGEDEFEFDGKTYKVEEALIAEDFKINYVTITEDLFKADSNWWVKNKLNVSSEISNALSGCKIKHVVIDVDKVHESVVNEGRVKATTLLQELIDGNTSRAEGIKMSKDLAEHYLYWLRTSPYGKKNADLPLYMLIKASFNWGIERQLDPKLKVELEALKASQMKNESVESIDEARSISKIQYDWSKVTTQMQATAQNWKAAEGPAKEMLLGKLKEMTAQKKALEAELDTAIADKDKDLELVVTEAFFRLPKDVIGNELYLATQNLSNLYGRTLAGNDIDTGVIDTIIKALTTVKKSVKKFNNKEEVLGTVYEAEVKSDEEFKEYAMTVLKKAFGDEFDEDKATEVVDGILKKCGDDYGACVGMITASLGESVVTEAFDANYWEDYHENAPKITNPSGMQIQQEVEAAVEEWNDNNEMEEENEVTPAGEKKVLKLAKEFVKAKGYICHDVIGAMIAQES